MKDRSRYFLVATGAIMVLIAIALVVTFQPYNARVVNQNLLKECGTSWPPQSPGPNVSQREQFAVLMASPGTSPKLCVGYSSLINSPVSLHLGALVVPLNSSTGDVSISAEPYNLTVPSDNNGMSPVGVGYAVFTLHIPNDSLGFYILDLPGDCPRLLASGYPAAQINQSDFGIWVQRASSCTGNPQSAPNVTLELSGESGLNLIYPYVS